MIIITTRFLAWPKLSVQCTRQAAHAAASADTLNTAHSVTDTDTETETETETETATDTLTNAKAAAKRALKQRNKPEKNMNTREGGRGGHTSLDDVQVQ